MTNSSPTLPDLSQLPPAVAASIVDHVQALIEQFAASAQPTERTTDWITAHRAWLKSLPQRTEGTLDDSRDSIYEGRGE